MDEKKTAGQIATDLMAKTPDTQDPIELQRTMTENYERDFYECVARGKTWATKDFYVVVLTKKERLLPNVLRLYFMDAKACPTPEYDQTVYKYHLAKDEPELLWCIPSRDTCLVFLDNKTAIHPSEWSLLENILKFEDKTLYKLSMQLNGDEETEKMAHVIEVKL